MTDEVMDPQELARSVAVETSERTDAVGDFVTSIDLGDGVTDFRFVSNLVGYEGWQWSVTLYHDEETQRWTVNESTLVPTEDSLLPPPWVPWKDRLKPSDLSVVDSIGTDENDVRLEGGFRPVNHNVEDNSNNNSETEAEASSVSEANAEDETNNADTVDDNNQNDENVVGEQIHQQNNQNNQDNQNDSELSFNNDSNEDLEEAVSTLRLSRSRVMTAEAISQTAKRWYSGQHGPKSLSTKVADGKTCSSCGFLIPLAGSLGTMFGVCANMWSPDDGKVVALDHACGEHSEIDPPEPSQLWVQSAPAYDDYHIDILQQAPRDERADVELIEEAIEDSKTYRRKRRKISNSVNKNKKDSQNQKKEKTQNKQESKSEDDPLDIKETDIQFENSYDDEKTEEIQVIKAKEELNTETKPNIGEERTHSTGSNVMRLYKRKSRSKHK